VGAVTGQVVNQAYLLSTIDFFRASAWLAVLLIPLVWMTNKAMSAGGPPPAD
jgi:DHA2 family multidrug resistance protein